MGFLIGLALFVIFCIVEADGIDWERGQRNADRRTRAIIGAIHSSASSITSCSQNIWEEQKRLMIEEHNKQYADVDEYKRFQDSHGRWFRERLVYDNEGRIIAKEVIGVEQ